MGGRSGRQSLAELKANGLTIKQARFVTEYTVDCNAKQAAIRAGYAPRSAEGTTSRMLRNAKVSAAVAKAQAARFQKVELTAESILREAGALAFSNLQDLVDDENPRCHRDDIVRMVAWYGAVRYRSGAEGEGTLEAPEEVHDA